MAHKKHVNNVNNIFIAIFYAIITLSITGFIFSSFTSPGFIQDVGPIAYFNFDEDVADHATHRYDAINHGAAFVPGVVGGALRFDGIDDYVRIPIDIDPDAMPELTFTAWVKTNKQEGTIMSHDNGGFDRTVDIDYRGGAWGWSAFAGTGGVLGYQPVSLGKWTFIAVVYNQPRGTVSLFVDGQIYEKIGTLSPGLPYLYLGGNPTYGAFFSGMIDEVRFYDQALSLRDLRQIYQGAEPVSTPAEIFDQQQSGNLLAYFNFDEDVEDHSGNGYDAINSGATRSSGYRGGSLYFDGQDYVRVPLDINPYAYPKLTITAWVKTEQLNGTIVCHDNGGFDRSLHIDTRGGGLGWSAFAGNQGVLGYHPIELDRWTFVAVVYDQSVSKVSLFVDGQVYETLGTLSQGLPYLYIGANPTYGANFQGYIDEVRFYRGALSLKTLREIHEDKMDRPQPQTASIVCHFPFDHDVQDYGDAGYHGQNFGADFLPGLKGNALYLDGIDDYVKIPIDINAENVPALTITAWVKPASDIGTLVSQDDGGFDRTIDIDERGGGKGWSAFAGTGGVLGFAPVQVGEWTFLAVVYDQLTETVRLYVNDQKFEKKGKLGKGREYFYIGANPSFGYHFKGLVDDVRVYSKVMTEGEINGLRSDKIMEPEDIREEEVVDTDIGNNVDETLVELKRKGQETLDLPGKEVTKIFSANEAGILINNNLVLNIPESGLNKQTEIKVIEFSAYPQSQPNISSFPEIYCISPIYDLLPDGITFQRPVKVSISYDPSILPTNYNSENIQMLYFNGVNWVTIGGKVDRMNGTVSAMIGDFPGAAFALGYALKVLVTGITTYVIWEKIGLINTIEGYVKGGEPQVMDKEAYKYVTPTEPWIKDYYAKRICADGVLWDHSAQLEQFLVTKNHLKSTAKVDQAVFIKMELNIDGKLILPQGPDQDQWLMPVDFFKRNMKFGDCNDIANGYCSIFRAKGLRAWCVSGSTESSRAKNQDHVWIEIEIGGEPYFFEQGRLYGLEAAERIFKLRRKMGLSIEGWMWNEEKQVPYIEKWWEGVRVDFDQKYHCYINLSNIDVRYKKEDNSTYWKTDSWSWSVFSGAFNPGGGEWDGKLVKAFYGGPKVFDQPNASTKTQFEIFINLAGTEVLYLNATEEGNVWNLPFKQKLVIDKAIPFSKLIEKGSDAGIFFEDNGSNIDVSGLTSIGIRKDTGNDEIKEIKLKPESKLSIRFQPAMVK